MQIAKLNKKLNSRCFVVIDVYLNVVYFYTDYDITRRLLPSDKFRYLNRLMMVKHAIELGFGFKLQSGGLIKEIKTIDALEALLIVVEMHMNKQSNLTVTTN